ncbi:unnamed protein product [Phytomonas sp. EM1]|nr:unnamed protein product [Phytomonas sp. EM1]|eukprot:CCW65844.1 unnamed protein product [Phytomonas sp. isolate EM1]
MPEACFLCLDSSEYMRNGDQFPNRLMAEQEAANLLVNAKIQMNAENVVGFLTTGGSACTVFETLTLDVDRVMASLSKITISGPKCHFAKGLLIASLALTHRTNPRAEKRIVAFVGSPMQETPKDLEALARKLRKEDVAVDVVVFGVEENVPLLESFVEKVNRNGNSRLLSVSKDANLTDALMSSPILLGGEDLNPGSGGGASVGFGVDPNVDPELAMALRLSLEEEQQQQAVAATVASERARDEEATTVSSPPANATQPATADAELDFANMSEEEMLQRALALSLEDAGPGQAQDQLATSSGFTKENEEGGTESTKEVREGSEKGDEKKNQN